MFHFYRLVDVYFLLGARDTLQDLDELARLKAKDHEEIETKLSEGLGDTFVPSPPPPPDYADVTKTLRASISRFVLSVLCDIAYWYFEPGSNSQVGQVVSYYTLIISIDKWFYFVSFGSRAQKCCLPSS